MSFLMDHFLSTLYLMVPSLMSVAFFTLMERKTLALSQMRLGPNKISFKGLFQPLADAIKLLSKSYIYNMGSNKIMYNFFPGFMIILSLLIWVILPHLYFSSNWMLTFMIVLTLLGMGVYPIMMCGWASNTNYSMVGCMRGVAQCISYEISLGVIVLGYMILLMSSSTGQFSNSSSVMFLGAMFMVGNLLLYISLIAETNRSPFDFAEGESELISGFNIEYSSVGFVMIFLAEYLSIFIVASLVTSLMFNFQMFSLGGCLMVLIISWTWIQLRASFPRYRYDSLMMLAWKTLLPEGLVLIVCNCLFSLF